MNPVWASYADAAKKHGIDVRTIRRWAQHKHVHVRKTKRGNKIIRTEVNLHSIDSHLDRLRKERKERMLNKRKPS